MESKKEQALVGFFVLVAIAILLIAMFSISGFFNGSGNLTTPISRTPAACKRAEVALCRRPSDRPHLERRA